MKNKKENYEKNKNLYTCRDCKLYEYCWGNDPWTDCTYVDHPICEDFKKLK